MMLYAFAAGYRPAFDRDLLYPGENAEGGREGRREGGREGGREGNVMIILTALNNFTHN